MSRREPPRPEPADRLGALLAEHGELMSGRALWHVLGFLSERSFQRAAQRDTLPVAVFTLPARRGRFARTRDIAAWLDGVVVDRPAAGPGAGGG